MELFVLRLPLRRAYETSGSRETHQTRVLCRVESQGAAGWGESVAPIAMALRASSAEWIDSSRQTAVRISRCSAAWSTRSSCASGCSIIVGAYSSMCWKSATSASEYAEFASSMNARSGNAARMASATSASQPGLIFTFTR